MSKKGGYVIVDLKGQSITAGTPFTLDGVTARLDRAKNKACLLSGFAIGNDEKRDVFVDLQKTEDGYIALFGQYTITIEDDEVTITDGGVLLDNIVDSNGNKRFISGNATKGSTLTKMDLVFGKWNLSGNHLMIVGLFKVTEDGEYAGGQTLFTITVPNFIKDKIKLINNSASIVAAEAGIRVRVEGQNWVVATVASQMRYQSGNTYQVLLTGSTTSFLVNDGIRFEYDLLID